MIRDGQVSIVHTDMEIKNKCSISIKSGDLFQCHEAQKIPRNPRYKRSSFVFRLFLMALLLPRSVLDTCTWPAQDSDLPNRVCFWRERMFAKPHGCRRAYSWPIGYSEDFQFLLKDFNLN